ncbi:prealbumin-like fold domain-containing protein [Sinorhizobium meliloti]|uniref:DUF7933 domain-containing protein n=1 Tax=Rhizobium meliloti TaxID=382 RepID=UPI003D64B12A
MGAAFAAVELMAVAAQAQEVTTFGPGSYTYTVPAGVTRVKVRVVGGGGGTGDDFNRTENGNGGAARIIDAIVNVSPGTVVSGTVGSGGKAGYIDSGGAGGTGTGRGGSGGSTATLSGGSPGGGGGGGSSLALGSTVILKAGGGGGGGGGAGADYVNPVYDPEHGGNAGVPTSSANCNGSGNGGSAAYRENGENNPKNGGGGGGGGGGYTGGSAGSGYPYNASNNGTASTGGGSCRSSQGGLFETISWSLTTPSSGTWDNGADGYVQITELKPSLTKKFSASSVKKGETFTLTFTLANPADAAAQTGLAFIDTLPSGLVLAGTPAASQCEGSVSVTDGNKISFSGGKLAAGPSSCTVTAQVTTAETQGPATCANASTTNGPGNISGLSANLANGVTNQCVSVRSTAVLTKAFGASSIGRDATTALTFTLTKPSTLAAQTGLAFTDTLPSGLVLASTPTASQCGGGTVEGTAGGGTIKFSGGSLPLSTNSCTVTVTVKAAATQGPAQCGNASTTNGKGNISGLSDNLANGVTSQCLAITSAAPTLTIAKVSEGGTGTFGFKGTAANGNGFPTDGSYSVTTTAAGTSATGPQVTLAAAGVATAIEETLAPGWQLAGARCEDLNWQQTGNPPGKAIGSVAGGRTLTIPAANAKEGAKLSCTFTNRFVGFTLSGRVIGDNGAGGGTAHDGVRGGAEAGLGGVPVRFTDCGATTVASTLTAGDGTFSLPLAGPAAGASVCVVRDAVTDLTGVSGKAGNTGGTVATPGYDAVAFTLAANSSYSGVVFGAIANPALATDGTASVAPGATVFLAHRYSATTTGNVSFSIANATGQPGLSAFTYTLMRDADCSGTLEASEPAVSGAIGVAAGDEVCLIVRVQASAGAAAGAALEYDVTAETALSGTLAVLAALTDHDVVTVSGGGTITLVKRVRNVTSGSGFAVTSAGGPGDILEYRITFTNPSAEAVSNVSVYDETPAYTSLAVPPGATVVATPSGMNCTMVVPAGGGSNGYTGPLQWKCTGTMPPGGTGRVAFRAKIAD